MQPIKLDWNFFSNILYNIVADKCTFYAQTTQHVFHLLCQHVWLLTEQMLRLTREVVRNPNKVDWDETGSNRNGLLGSSKSINVFLLIHFKNNFVYTSTRSEKTATSSCILVFLLIFDKQGNEVERVSKILTRTTHRISIAAHNFIRSYIHSKTREYLEMSLKWIWKRENV